MSGVYIKDLSKEDIIGLKAVFRDKVAVVLDHGRLVDADAFHKRFTDEICKDCDRRKGIKNGKRRILYAIGDAPCRACFIDDAFDLVDAMPTIIEAEEEDGCKK